MSQNKVAAAAYLTILGGGAITPASDDTTLAVTAEPGRNGPPAASPTKSRNRIRFYLVPMVVLVDVLILGTLGGFLGYFMVALIAYGGKFSKGYEDVEAILSLPMGWAASLLSLIAFSVFLKLRKKHRTVLSRTLLRSALVSLGSAFAVTFVLYLLLFLEAI